MYVLNSFCQPFIQTIILHLLNTNNYYSFQLNSCNQVVCQLYCVRVKIFMDFLDYELKIIIAFEYSSVHVTHESFTQEAGKFTNP